MLNTRILRQDPETVALRLRIKGFVLDIAEFRALETERASLQQETERLQHERNSKSKAIGQAKARGEDIAPLVAEVGGLGDRLHDLRANLGELQERYQAFLHDIPNMPDPSVPEGEDESGNLELRSWGELPRFNFEPRDHVDLGAGGSLDFEAAARISGSRYVVMKGEVARLHRALTQFMLDTHVGDHGYTEVYVPYIVNAAALFGTGQLPKFAHDQFRLAEPSEAYLAPTAEVPVTNIYRETILGADALPIRHVCHTPCFRREAGAYGQDTRGMIRQHQFHKVEIVSVTHPDASAEELERMTLAAEAILERLELPYRRVLLCAGDMGAAARKTYDLEVWLPGQGAYREISSCSVCGDYQARRMNARFRPEGSKATRFVHTLNGSGLAVGRTLIALLENGQQADGSVVLPPAIRPYMGGCERLE